MATITKRGNSYKITVSCGYDASGKQVRRHMTWTPPEGMAKTKIEKELQRQAVLFEDECAGRGASGNIKFSQLADEWIAYAEKNEILRPNTLYKTKELKERTYAAVGHLRADKISPIQLQRFIDNLSEPGINKRNGKGLSPKTQSHYLTFVTNVMNYGVRLGMIRENPCKSVSVRRRPPPERDFYTLEEAQLFLDKLQKAPTLYQVYFQIALLGGLRSSEIRGLKWMDVDFNHNVLTISRSLNYVPKDGLYESETKTEGSARTIKLPQIIFDTLKSLKREQAENYLKIGVPWLNERYIIVSAAGDPLGSTTPNAWLKRFCGKNEIKYISPHGFRHTNATLLINQNVDIKTVSASLGHSQASTTINIYSHAIQAAQARASDALAESLLLDEKKATSK